MKRRRLFNDRWFMLAFLNGLDYEEMAYSWQAMIGLWAKDGAKNSGNFFIRFLFIQIRSWLQIVESTTQPYRSAARM